MNALVWISDILLAVTEVHQLNLKLAMGCSEFSRNFQRKLQEAEIDRRQD